jgi:hypothetical protein
MRRRSVVTALVVFTATLTVAALRRRAQAGRRETAPVAMAGRPISMAIPYRAPTPAPAPKAAAPQAATPQVAAPRPEAVRDAVVLPLVRPAAPVVTERVTAAVRCGDTGGRTKAGAPCGARGLVNGRCHHHRLAG